MPLRMEQSTEQISSYESLDKFNYALETLKLTDNYHDKNKVIDFLQNTTINNNSGDKINNTKIMINNNELLKNELDVNSGNCIVVVDDVDGRRGGSHQRLHACDADIQLYENDEDIQKQKQLSDWYYIKTSPKPKQISPYIKRKRIPNNNNNNNNTNTQNNNNIKVNHDDDKINYNLKSDEYNINKKVENIVNHKDHNNDEEKLSRKIFEENRNKFEKFHQQQQQMQQQKHLLSSPIQKKYKSNDLIQKQQHPDYQQYPDKILPASCKYIINRKLKNNNNQNQQQQQQPYNHHYHLGEMTSSSFEHVNVKCNLPEIIPVKLLNNQISSNSCCLIKNLNNEMNDKFNIMDSGSVNSTTIDNNHKYKAALSRPLPKLPSPPTTPYYDGDDDDVNVTVDKKVSAEASFFDKFFWLFCNYCQLIM